MGIGDLIALVLPPAAFALVAGWEIRRPARPGQSATARRWRTNLGLFALNGLLLAVLAPPFAQWLAMWRSGGAETMTDPPWAVAALSAIAAFLVLDCAGYGLHRAFHRAPMLWRLHRLHHSDGEIDATTGLRHHALELLLTLAALQIVGTLLAVPQPVFAAYGTLLLAQQVFQHGNIRLPHRLEHALARITITPRLHAVHHSQDRRHHDKNFGMILCCWDRLFGTYWPIDEQEESALRFGVGGAGRN